MVCATCKSLGGCAMDLWTTDANSSTFDKKTFKNAGFRMTLPEHYIFDNRIEFEYKYTLNSNSASYKSILAAVSIKNVFGEVSTDNEIQERIMGSRIVKCSAAISNVKSVSNADIDFMYLGTDGQKCIVKYKYERHASFPTFLGIERCDMSEPEKNYFISCIQASEQKEKTQDRPDESHAAVEVLRESRYRNMLTDYLDALQREKAFLKNNGGKKYKVSNGIRLTGDNREYYYQFEMETELFLSDDAPVIIKTSSGERADGKALVCEEFQIIISINKDLGECVPRAELAVEPWKLLGAQYDRITQLNRIDHPLAMKIVEDGPAYATKKPIELIPKGQDKVCERLATNDITVVWGPPGTGKTYTMSEIAIDYMKRGKNVLIVSHSNVSVDGVIKKISDSLRKTGDFEYLQNGQVLRYGYIRDHELSADEEVSSYNYALKRSADIKRAIDALLSEKDSLKNQVDLDERKKVQIEKQLAKYRKKIRDEEKKNVTKAKIIGTTISKITVDKLFEYKMYDLVMFDEVSMAYVTQLVCAASFAKERFVCVGDFMQLPPIAQDESAKLTLEKDIFEYLGITDHNGGMYYHPWLVMLDTQRRMYPDIAEFVNKKIYNGLLQNHSSTVKNNIKTVEASPLAGNALNMIDLFGTYAAASKNGDNSRFNILSAVVSFASGLSSESEQVQSVGIITPYAAQMRLIRAMINDYRYKKTTNLTCSTVHQFQGSESDVIVFDAVESYPTAKAGYLMSKNPNTVKRLINVAITRTRGKLINVANSKFWLKEFESQKDHTYYQFVSHLTTKRNVVGCSGKRLQTYLSELNTGNNIHIYLQLEECFDRIKADFDSAIHQIIISIPDGKLIDGHEELLRLVESAQRRGVQILMKSKSYEQLPQEWKKYCVASENADFPLVMIDKKTIWYGVPLSKGEFKVGTTGFQTVCQTIIRIKGENTIDMISSLSELDTKKVGNRTCALLSKDQHERKTKGNIADSFGGFPAWIAGKEFCPRCKHPMQLSKGRSGRYFLQCSNSDCDNREYLRPEMINHYIRMNDIVCSQDGGELTAKIGQYGVYIVCDGGHTVKPDQI